MYQPIIVCFVLAKISFFRGGLRSHLILIRPIQTPVAVATRRGLLRYKLAAQPSFRSHVINKLPSGATGKAVRVAIVAKRPLQGVMLQLILFHVERVFRSQALDNVEILRTRGGAKAKHNAKAVGKCDLFAGGIGHGVAHGVPPVGGDVHGDVVCGHAQGALQGGFALAPSLCFGVLKGKVVNENDKLLREQGQLLDNHGHVANVLFANLDNAQAAVAKCSEQRAHHGGLATARRSVEQSVQGLESVEKKLCVLVQPIANFLETDKGQGRCVLDLVGRDDAQQLAVLVVPAKAVVAAHQA
mmetsp:Transcript_11345/g.27556  ORF Transcript_11345/g.27556 Transcript_11345/m.27556 type:complete len:300 (-) Transcript_11345:465-1364(-)